MMIWKNGILILALALGAMSAATKPPAPVQFGWGKGPVGPLTGEGLSARVHFKRAKKYVKSGMYYSAACHYLDGLKIKPKKKQIKRLTAIAGKGYDEQLDMANSFWEEESFREAREAFEHLEKYLRTLKKRRLQKFESVNVRTELEKMSGEASDKHYALAQDAFDREEWQGAITAYREALFFTQNYKDSREKVAFCFSRIGENLVSERRYRDAAGAFLEAHQSVDNYEDSQTRAVEIHYRLGVYYLDNNFPRAAWRDFDRIRDIMGNYKDAGRLRDEAMEAATIRLAMGTIENHSTYSVNGVVLGPYIMDKISSGLKKKKSRFLVLVGANDQAHYSLEGSISQISLNNNGPTVQKGSELVKWKEKQEYIDQNGEKKKRKVERSAMVYYARYDASRSLTIDGSLGMTDLDTGESLLQHNLYGKAADSVAWVIVPEKNGNETHLSYGIKSLIGARQNLQSPDALARRAVDPLVKNLPSQILAQLDKEQAAPSPEFLELDLF